MWGTVSRGPWLDHSYTSRQQEKMTATERQRAEAAERELENLRARLSSLQTELEQTQGALEQAREVAAKTASQGGKGKRGRGGGRPSSRK